MGGAHLTDWQWAMGFHSAGSFASRSHWASARGRPPDHRRHRLCGHCRLRLAGPPARVRRPDDDVTSAEMLGRERCVGAYLVLPLPLLTSKTSTAAISTA